MAGFQIQTRVLCKQVRFAVSASGFISADSPLPRPDTTQYGGQKRDGLSHFDMNYPVSSDTYARPPA